MFGVGRHDLEKLRAPEIAAADGDHVSFRRNLYLIGDVGFHEGEELAGDER